MADTTGISWTDATWNPVVGCSVVSPGCKNCYAMSIAHRLENMATRADGCGNPHLIHYIGLTTEDPTGRGYSWSKPVWTGKVALAPNSIFLKPLSWRKGKRIFVNSMGDLFHEAVPVEWIDRVFAVMALAPQHQFQVLTKRSRRMREYLSAPLVTTRIARQTLGLPDPPEAELNGPWPLPNVWLGVTAEDQARADERIPDLLATPAARRFVSVEPILGPVDLTRIDLGEKVTRGYGPKRIEWCALTGWEHQFGADTKSGCDEMLSRCARSSQHPHLDWVIVGGESGPNARPMQVGLARSIVAQCRDARVPCFVKQLGSDPVWEDGAFLNLRHRKGATMSEWPADLHVQEIPNAR